MPAFWFRPLSGEKMPIMAYEVGEAGQSILRIDCELQL